MLYRIKYNRLMAFDLVIDIANEGDIGPIIQQIEHSTNNEQAHRKLDIVTSNIATTIAGDVVYGPLRTEWVTNV